MLGDESSLSLGSLFCREQHFCDNTVLLLARRSGAATTLLLEDNSTYPTFYRLLCNFRNRAFVGTGTSRIDDSAHRYNPRYSLSLDNAAHEQFAQRDHHRPGRRDQYLFRINSHCG